MRALDGDAVRQAIDRATGNDKAAVAALHKSERLRDALIADDAALTKFIAQFPDVNVQEVRQLIRNARKEAEGNKPPKSARALYKLIYAMVLPPIVLEATRRKTMKNSKAKIGLVSISDRASSGTYRTKAFPL